MQKKNLFLAKSPENGNFNQYWFSQPTIEMLVSHLEQLYQENQNIRCAFLSTPSIYFSLQKELKDRSKIFEFDKKFDKDTGFVFYDFNNPLNLPQELQESFDLILIDPPFITLDVWEKYAQTAKFLGSPGVKYLLCSIKENDIMLNKLLNVEQRTLKPLIPHLIYQYNFYSNYQHPIFSEINPEVGF